MKFGKYLASRQLELPEYSGHFIDYKALKKLIKQLAIPSTASTTTTTTTTGSPPIITTTTASSQQEIQQTLKENRAQFFFRVERELDKVNSFYLEKQANLAINLDLLLMKKHELFAKSNEYIHQHGNTSTNNNNINANFKNSISFLNLYQNFKKIHQDLIRLQQFIELNETGFSKVVKKWDKRSKSRTKELFIQTAVSVQPVFHKNEINELSDLVTQSLFDIESIMEGDYTSLQALNGTSVPTSTSGGQPQILNSLSRDNSTTNISSGLANTDLSNPQFTTFSRSSSIVNIQNNEVDELYTSFVNVATIKDPDLSLLAQWIDKVKSSSKGSSGSAKSTAESGSKFNSLARYKITKILLLSVGNLKISDSFLESFLHLIDCDVDFTFINDDFNNNKNILHECCSIPPASTHESHVIINNGVKVLNSIDSVNHSRTFIVNYIFEKLTEAERISLLTGKDFAGRTCLHYASQNNRSDLLDIILPFFPKEHIDIMDNDSMTALLLTIKHGHFNIMKKLLQYGANGFPQADKGKLQYLPINYACRFGDYKTVEYLLSYDKSGEIKKVMNQQDVEGLLPLHVVSRSGHYKLIKLLIQYGADVNKLDGFNKWTPIFYAASEGHVKTTQELVKLGAKLNVIDEDGYNVLYYCVVEGHIDVVNELLSYYTTIENVEGICCGLTTNNKIANLNEMVSVDSGDKVIHDTILNDDDSEDSGSIEKNVDSIPDLQLPPPILPLRRYGHNFLEQKVLIELMFPADSSFINLFNSTTDLKPGRITLTSNISDIIPRNILLPIGDETKANNNTVFQTDIDTLHEFRIDFEIFPKFGTRLIAKTTALSFSELDTSSPELSTIQLPLFDLRLRNIGEIKFNYQIIFPFSGTLLETSKFDTYWKSSTSFVKNRQTLKLNAAGGLSPNNFLSPGNLNSNVNAPATTAAAVAHPAPSELMASSSIVTATSLSGEYLRVKICLLNDGTPVVCPHWSIPLTEKIDLYLPNLSLEQLTSITDDLFDYSKVIHDLARMSIKDIGSIKKLLRIVYLPLDIFLDILHVGINLNLELVFPSLYELRMLPFIGNIQANLNNFIDFTLNDVFNHIRTSKMDTCTPGRSIIFLSSNSLICKILNWKQPNFPVFLLMNGITYNSKQGKFESRTTNGLLIDDLKKWKSPGHESIIRTTTPTASTTTTTSEHHEDQESIQISRMADQYQEFATRSIKEAVNFTINNNLIGLVTSIHLLNLVPKLIPLIRSRGLVLVASSDVTDDENEECIQKELDSYTKTEINGLRFNDVLSFKEDISV
ncbi:PHO81 [[Candida] subhashii]|uniref:PHO81 n=1 Tax=[Candida] subhashii TaxID=561895 RepID=A0A8J5UMB5_9ASCO|nr:PHO81 [[Candida] subhashii]KAG7663196.1 PHO81 [[Candida] subhashii]